MNDTGDTVGRKDVITIYCSGDGEYRWRRTAPNGEPISGPQEGYTRRPDAFRAMRRANADYMNCIVVSE